MKTKVIPAPRRDYVLPTRVLIKDALLLPSQHQIALAALLVEKALAFAETGFGPEEKEVMDLSITLMWLFCSEDMEFDVPLIALRQRWQEISTTTDFKNNQKIRFQLLWDMMEVLDGNKSLKDIIVLAQALLLGRHFPDWLTLQQKRNEPEKPITHEEMEMLKLKPHIIEALTTQQRCFEKIKEVKMFQQDLLRGAIVGSIR